MSSADPPEPQAVHTDRGEAPAEGATQAGLPMPTLAPPGGPDESDNQRLLAELHARAAAQAAQAIGLSPAALMAAMPLLPGGVPGAPPALVGQGLVAPEQLQPSAAPPPAPPVASEAADAAPSLQVAAEAQAAVAPTEPIAISAEVVGGPSPEAISAAAGIMQSAMLLQQPPPAAMPTTLVRADDGEGEEEDDDEGAVYLSETNPPRAIALQAPDGEGEADFTCTVCRKVFKREMNLVFHMTTHRPKQPRDGGEGEGSMEPVTCQDCGKTFGTKYQAKKHYLRRHFRGDRPFGCNKCGKRFVVREDLTMHVKSCGNVYGCSCGIRLCSVGALKRHCKHFNHEPASLDPQVSNGLLLNMAAAPGALTAAPPPQMAPHMGGAPALPYAQMDFGAQQRAMAGVFAQGSYGRGGGGGGGVPQQVMDSRFAGQPASTDAFGFNCLSAAMHSQPPGAFGFPGGNPAGAALNLMAGAAASTEQGYSLTPASASSIPTALAAALASSRGMPGLCGGSNYAMELLSRTSAHLQTGQTAHGHADAYADNSSFAVAAAMAAAAAGGWKGTEGAPAPRAVPLQGSIQGALSPAYIGGGDMPPNGMQQLG